MLTTEYINILLKLLVDSYFIKSSCVFLFTDNSNIIELNFPLPVVYFKNELLPEKLFRNYGCRDIIIDYENSQAIFQKFEHLIRHELVERYNTRRYVIVLKNNTEESVEEFFQMDELDNVCDVLLIKMQTENEPDEDFAFKNHFYNRISEGNKIYEFSTHQFGGNNSRKIQLLDKWFSKNSSFLHNNNLFPDKLRNLLGRSFAISIMNYAPYTVINSNKGILDGVETRLIFEFFKKYNLTATFRQFEDYNWGDIYPNWTGYGVLGDVAMGNADIGIAAIFFWEKFYNFTDYSRNLLRVGMTVIAPAPKPAAGWLIPILSFTADTWAILALTFIISIFALFLSLTIQNFGNSKMKFSYSLITLTRAYLLQSLVIIPGGKVYKFLIGIFLLKILIISSSYSSGLASVMTIPRYEHAILSVQDLADSDLEYGNADSVFILAIKNVNYGPYKKIKTKFRVYTESELAEISKTYNFAFLVERLPFGHICVGEFIERDVIYGYRIMRDDIYWEQTTFALRKHSVLLPLLDNLILKIYESGIEAYWEHQVTVQYMDPVIQRVLRYYNIYGETNDNEPVKLQWQHVQGPFGILFGGLLVSSLCFLGELVVYKRKNGIEKSLES